MSWLAHAELHPKASARHLLRAAVAVEATAAYFEPAYIARRRARAFIVAGQPVTAIGRSLAVVANVSPWSDGL